jgi:hypothetical protein
MAAASQTTIKKLPPIKEDVGAMRQRIQDVMKKKHQTKGTYINMLCNLNFYLFS